MARVLVLNVIDGNDDVYVTDCTELKDFYKELGCDVFDITQLPVGERVYDIFVDDIGLFREEIVVSAINERYEPLLVGNLIFANHDSQGNTTDLTDEDISNIKKHIRQFADGKALKIKSGRR